MIRLQLQNVAFALLCLVSCTYQVDVTFAAGSPWGPHDIETTTCLDLLPGQCCQHYVYAQTIAVTFDGLQVTDVSVAWGRQTTQVAMIGQCTGIVLQTGAGPGTWNYNWAHSYDDIYSFGPSGASYIRLPPRLPPGQAEADWLNVEGLKALVWGGGKWVTSGGASGILGPRSNDDAEMKMMPPQMSNNRALYRGGRFYASPPPGTRFPDLVTVNGTVYSAVGKNGTLYKDAAGNLLDVSSLGR